MHSTVFCCVIPLLTVQNVDFHCCYAFPLLLLLLHSNHIGMRHAQCHSNALFVRRVRLRVYAWNESMIFNLWRLRELSKILNKQTKNRYIRIRLNLPHPSDNPECRCTRFARPCTPYRTATFNDLSSWSSLINGCWFFRFWSSDCSASGRNSNCSVALYLIGFGAPLLPWLT